MSLHNFITPFRSRVHQRAHRSSSDLAMGIQQAIPTLVSCCVAILLGTFGLRSQTGSADWPTNEAFQRAAATETIERNPREALRLFRQIALDESLDPTLRRHAWLRVGALVPRVPGPFDWASSPDSARTKALERAMGEDAIGERARAELAKQPIDTERWRELEAHAELLLSKSSIDADAILWLGKPAVGPILKKLGGDVPHRFFYYLTDCLVRIEDPRIEPFFRSAFKSRPEAPDHVNGRLRDFWQGAGICYYAGLLPEIAERSSESRIGWALGQGLLDQKQLHKMEQSESLEISIRASYELFERTFKASVSEEAVRSAAEKLLRSPITGPTAAQTLVSDYFHRPAIRRLLLERLGQDQFSPLTKFGDSVENDTEAVDLLTVALERFEAGVWQTDKLDQPTQKSGSHAVKVAASVLQRIVPKILTRLRKSATIKDATVTAPVLAALEVALQAEDSDATEICGPQWLNAALLAAAETGHAEVGRSLELLAKRQHLPQSLWTAAKRYHQVRDDAVSRAAAFWCFKSSGSPREPDRGYSDPRKYLRQALLQEEAIDWAEEVRAEDVFSHLNFKELTPSFYDRSDEGCPFDQVELTEIWSIALETHGYEAISFSTYLDDLPPYLVELVVSAANRSFDVTSGRGDNKNDDPYFRLWSHLADRNSAPELQSKFALSEAQRIQREQTLCFPSLNAERDSQAVALLQDHAESSLEAFQVLQKHRIGIPLETLRQILSDSDRAERFLRCLRPIQGQEAALAVSEHLRRRVTEVAPDCPIDMDEAIDALKRLGDRRGLPALAMAYRRLEGHGREAAKRAIETLRYVVELDPTLEQLDPDRPDLRPAKVATQLILQARPNQDKPTRLLAIQSLGALGEASTLAELLVWTSEEDEEIAQASRNAIERIVTQTSLPLVKPGRPESKR